MLLTANDKQSVYADKIEVVELQWPLRPEA